LSKQFVLHECAGYILIGRHVIADYMAVLDNSEPLAVLAAKTVRERGGLSDGIIRLYPGGHLKSIDWLQKSSVVRGAEKISSAKIELTQHITSNALAMRPMHHIKMAADEKKP